MELSKTIYNDNLTYYRYGNFHVLRIDPKNNFPFIIGPKHCGVTEKGLGSTYLSREISEIESGGWNYSYQNKVLTPIWISNGTFFGPNSNVIKGSKPPKNPKYTELMGWNKGLDWCNKPNKNLIDKKKFKRGMLLCNDSKNYRNVEVFVPSTVKQGDLAFENHKWVIGGAGVLIKDGIPHTDLKFWNTFDGGNFVNTDQSYSCGTIYAKSLTGIHYLIMNTNIPGNYKCTSENSFSWKHAAEYLSTQFLKDIECEQDKYIYDAIVWDGSSARQLWVKGEGKIPIYQKEKDGSIIESIRPVPQFICVFSAY